jgi:membrane protein YdbS with pleckstrin-like domain
MSDYDDPTAPPPGGEPRAHRLRREGSPEPREPDLMTDTVDGFPPVQTTARGQYAVPEQSNPVPGFDDEPPELSDAPAPMQAARVPASDTRFMSRRARNKMSEGETYYGEWRQHLISLGLPLWSFVGCWVALFIVMAGGAFVGGPLRWVLNILGPLACAVLVLATLLSNGGTLHSKMSRGRKIGIALAILGSFLLLGLVLVVFQVNPWDALMGFAHGLGAVVMFIINHWSVLNLMLAITAIATLMFLWHLYEWYHNTVLLTDRALTRFYGVVTLRSPSMPLSKIVNSEIVRPWLGRIFGYGTVEFETAGQVEMIPELRHMKNVDEFMRLLNQAEMHHSNSED